MSASAAQRWKLSRTELDAFSAESHRRALAAAKAGRFKKETLPVVVPAEKKTVDADEGPREDSTPAKLAKLKPAFQSDGVVTAGNASQISDGAAAVVLMSELPLEAFDLIEINEAFAASTIAGIRDLKLDPEKVNPYGGGIALGHPIGASGARIVVTLLHALADRKLRRGLATLCMGGGNGLALGVERP